MRLPLYLIMTIGTHHTTPLEPFNFFLVSRTIYLFKELQILCDLRSNSRSIFLIIILQTLKPFKSYKNKCYVSKELEMLTIAVVACICSFPQLGSLLLPEL